MSTLARKRTARYTSAPANALVSSAVADVIAGATPGRGNDLKHSYVQLKSPFYAILRLEFDILASMKRYHSTPPTPNIETVHICARERVCILGCSGRDCERDSWTRHRMSVAIIIAVYKIL